VREMLEGEAARLAAVHIAEGDHRQRMEAQQAAVLTVRRDSDPLSYMAHNTSLHDEIFAVSQNRLLAHFATQLHTQIYRLQFQRLLRNEASRLESIDDHVAIVEAILAGNAKAAEKAMRRHVRRSADVTGALPDSAFA
jgi:DNA-binding GntR family transcriptional regulator